MTRVDIEALERGIRDGHCPANGCDDFLPLLAELRAARAVVDAARDLANADGTACDQCDQLPWEPFGCALIAYNKAVGEVPR